jgi:hypothetical protein
MVRTLFQLFLKKASEIELSKEKPQVMVKVFKEEMLLFNQKIGLPQNFKFWHWCGAQKSVSNE